MENLFLKDFDLIYLSLGSNVGEKLFNLKMVVKYLNFYGRVVKISGIYLSEPWGEKNQPWFLNAGIFYETSFTPIELLKIVKLLENKIGRYKMSRWGKRKIDVDIIFYKNFSVNVGAYLNIPHRYWQNRAFVCVPLRELVEDCGFRWRVDAGEKSSVFRVGKLL